LIVFLPDLTSLGCSPARRASKRTAMPRWLRLFFGEGATKVAEMKGP